jgi:hypothetical protein
MSTIVQIPQRFMLVHGLSAIDAGVRLLPFTIVMASTSIVLSIIISKADVPAMLTLIFGAALQIAGVAGLSQSSTGSGIEASVFGFEILAGAGVGLFNVITILLTPRIVDKRDLGTSNIQSPPMHTTDSSLNSCG